MIYYLLNKDLEYISVIENYRSFIWTSRYNTFGDFELYLPASKENIALYKRGYYIIRDTDRKHAMIIYNIEIQTDIENGDFLIITGRCLKSILYQRIIWSQTVVNGNVETKIRELVTDNCISPSIEARAISRLTLGSVIGITDTIKTQYTGDNLGETITGLCETFGLGFDVELDIPNHQFKFVMLKGEDRTYNQNVNPVVVFSNDFDNLLTTDYIMNSEEYKNVALVAGEGEGTSRKVASVGGATDLDRFEIYVDARDISSNEGEIPYADYIELLADKGFEELAECQIVKSISGEVLPDYTYKLNIDYFLGDLVEIRNDYGVKMVSRITEIIECNDENGYSCIPTFTS